MEGCMAAPKRVRSVINQ